ncbi:hypothetical protein AB0K00_51390 [Dactylosporangium sp. NPDC049525]|uniref:hypothetical protein n=1 Tax=Dactylosporangium sp. NPDC049525 TaxID=3154730 RepID=UPI00343D4BB1
MAAVIDEEWLDEQLRFDIPGGYRLDGCRVGGSWVVIFVQYPDRPDQAIKIPRAPFLFPSYIREIPNFLAPSPRYDLGRLNRKLAGMLGDLQVPLLVMGYRELFDALVGTLRTNDVWQLDAISGETEEDTARLRFLLATPPVEYLLSDDASEHRDPATRLWAERALAALDRLRPDVQAFRPDIMLDNPLLVWGGAVMSGYFTKAELPHAASAALDHLDPADEERLAVFLAQATMLVDALTGIVGTSLGLRKLCDATELFPWRFVTDEELAEPDGFIRFHLA